MPTFQWILTANFLALALSVINGLHFLVFGVLCVASEPAQAPSAKLISHVSGSLSVYSNKLSSFGFHLLIYSAKELLTLCVTLPWWPGRMIIVYYLRVISPREKILLLHFYL